MDTIARPHCTQTGLSRVPGGPHDHLLAIYAMADRQTTWPEASRWRARQRGRRQVPVLRQETPRTGPHRPDVGLHVAHPIPRTPGACRAVPVEGARHRSSF